MRSTRHDERDYDKHCGLDSEEDKREQADNYYQSVQEEKRYNRFLTKGEKE